MTKTCLRCDWEGETEAAACPACGAPLYRPAPPDRERRAAPRASSRGPDATERTPSAPDPVARPPTSTSPVAVVLIAGVVFAVIAFLLAQGPRPSPGDVVRSSPAPEGTGGRLIYAVPVADGMARLWRWDLRAGEVSRGPLVREPLALVNILSPGYGWLGITSEGARGGREASVLDSFEPGATAERVGRGDIVTWTRQGATVLLVERGPLRDRCRRVVEVTAVDVGQPGRERILREILCGDILSVGRTSVGYFMTVLRGDGADVVGFGYPNAGVLLRDHGVIDISPGGEMLVTPESEFLPVRSSDAGPVAPVRGEAWSFRLFGGRPVDLLADAAPLWIAEVLAYTDGGTRALVLGRQGPDDPAVWDVPLGIAGAEPEIPRYVIEARGITTAAFANDGTAFILTDGRLWHLQDGRLTAVELPEGAPGPAGAIAWIVREPLTEL